ncbi:MAG: hypothetical protein IJ275_06735 [Ruminococcus sp.]|nr:hypothetical protein [Ruminococcus sp.]
MSIKEVIDRFALVSGLEQEDISKWIFIIVDCIKYFESMVDVSKLPDYKYTRLVNACAVYAYYKYSLYSLISTTSKFKAGDIEITQSESISDKAHIMWQQEKIAIADIIDFDDFCFKRV